MCTAIFLISVPALEYKQKKIKPIQHKNTVKISKPRVAVMSAKIVVNNSSDCLSLSFPDPIRCDGCTKYIEAMMCKPESKWKPRTKAQKCCQHWKRAAVKGSQKAEAHKQAYTFLETKGYAPAPVSAPVPVPAPAEASKYASTRKNICKTIWNGIHLKVSSGGSDPIGRRGTKRSLHSMLMTPVQTTNKQTTYRKKRSKLSPSNTAAPINFLVNSVRKIASTIFSPVLNNKSTPDTHQSCESDDSFCESEDGNFDAALSLLSSNVDSPLIDRVHPPAQGKCYQHSIDSPQEEYQSRHDSPLRVVDRTDLSYQAEDCYVEESSQGEHQWQQQRGSMELLEDELESCGLPVYSSNYQQSKKASATFSALDTYGIPLNGKEELRKVQVAKEAIGALIDSDLRTEHDIITIPTQRSVTHVVLLKPVSTEASYNNYDKSRINSIPRLLVPASSYTNEKELEKEEKLRAFWVAQSLAKKYPDEFKKAGEEVLDMVSPEPLSVSNTIAMFIGVGLNSKMSQRLRSYLRTFFGFQLLASNRNCLEFQNDMDIPDPEFGHYEMGGGKRIQWSQVNMAENVLRQIEKYMVDESSDGAEIKRIILLFCGDHGQGSYVDLIQVNLMNGLDSYARCLAFPSFQLSHIE